MNRPPSSNLDPHAAQPLLTAGPTPESAAGTLILIHGRGASAESILSLYEELNLPNLAAVAPQAAGHTWYPNSFLAPLESNQPYLESAIKRLRVIVDDLNARGVASERIALLGFSQGACLCTEFVARNAQHFGPVMALTGGLIGPAGTPRTYAGSLAGTNVFLGSSDPDLHVPFARVKETEGVFSGMGAVVQLRRYAGMPHTVNEEEIEVCRTMLTEWMA